ncbi:MAG: TIM barrel protein, partial [Moorea sp. SIO3I7]|nr:TIM barrel protein [Moorena sp. SIO3I7]
SILALTIIVSLTIFSLPASAFVQADLEKFLETGNCSGCNLSEEFFFGDDFSGADLSNANLSNATFYNVDLNGANLSNATLTNANLERSELNNANLSEAQGENAIFKKAILVEANLSAADFSKANMQNANLADATLKGTKLCDAFLFEATMPDGTTYLDGVTNLCKYNVDLTCGEASVEVSQFDPFSCVETPIIEGFNDLPLGITPTGWSNSDDQCIDLNPPIPYQQILNEIAESGFYGTQNAPKFPEKEDLKKELELRGLTISEPWVGTYFTEGKQEESIAELDKQIAFMDGFDSNVIVVAELGNAVHLDLEKDPIKEEPVFTPDQNQALYDGLKQLADKAEKAKYTLVYHPHVGTGVATIDHIKNLMDNTADSQLKLLLDTGHVYYATYGHDSDLTPQKIQAQIEELTNTYKDRIKHFHLKNIRKDKLAESVDEGRSFLNSIRAGVFTVPGDAEGVINFNPILKTLADANYEGWLIVEAEQDPNTTMGYNPPKTPLDYANMAREYLCEQTGL